MVNLVDKRKKESKSILVLWFLETKSMFYIDILLFDRAMFFDVVVVVVICICGWHGSDDID